ncbi:PAS-domain containing protein [Cognatishimia maritima]|uniref:histidine kinase n=1 Tax=Cognatishimia maritima TaxID=870908 RepID=A0A1M5SQA7_9RHOB|nr:PAS-domain containing protein [Cognatishimia maritima]SHH40587.1 Signal transduction histidine kinase [Cognatishimia maritima]
MPVRDDTKAAMTMAGLNLIKQGLSIFDSDLKLVVANARFREMFEVPDSLARPGTSFQDLIRHMVARGEYGTDQSAEEMVRERVELAKAFEPHYIERQRSNGRWISVEGSPLPDGGWITVYTDITQVRRQEELLRSRSEVLSDQLIRYAEDLSSANRELESTVIALEEAKRQIMESEARMRLTAEMMPAHIAHVGPDRCYTYSNRRLSAVMPGRPSNIVGAHIKDTLGAETYQIIAPKLQVALSGDSTVFEFNDPKSTRRIRLALTPDSEDGDAQGVYILSMDVTEEAQARAALQQTKRREIAAQMTSGLAHDFSNLLTIILGMQGKLEKMDLPAEAHELIDGTLATARRGGKLLNSLADVTSQRAPQLQPTDVGALLRDSMTLARPILNKSIDLQLQDRTPNEPLILDPGMLQDSLFNLILNARDGCDGAGRITICCETVQDTWLQISVQDTGKGFSDEALTHAFDPFFTTKGAAGTGLGLPMVYDVTKLVGGEVRIANAEGGGAIVRLRLPLRRLRADQSTSLVLLVEDDPDLRDQIREMLIDQNHMVIEASSVDEALLLVEHVPGISAVLSDINLEGNATGVDLAGKLGKTDIPVILMTSLPTTHSLYQDGAARAPIIRKPFAASDLVPLLTLKDPQ